MADVQTNLRVLKPSRAKLRVGDVFAMLPPDDMFLFGRVILADLPRGRAPMPGANLIYVYRHRSSSKEPDRAALDPEGLLLPPLFINRLPWSKGYFETVAHWPLDKDDLLPRHCFRDWTGDYVDESGERLPGPSEPCGDYGLHSYRTVDDEISDALGLERAPA
jgi:hypothetical protein